MILDACKTQAVGLGAIVSLLLASPGLALVECKRVGDDPYGTAQDLIIDGDQGAFVYNSAKGTKEVLTLDCAATPTEPAGYLCQRVFQHPEGLTVEHYLIPKVGIYASLTVTTFVQNGGDIMDLGQHHASQDSFAVSCKGSSGG